MEIQAEVRTACAGLSPRHAARFQSTCGQHAGSWLAVFPMSGWATARARHYQLGLVARLGLPMVEFMPIAGLSRLCRFCRAALDVHGWHAGLCGKGNTESLWTRRHDVVQMALLIVSRRYGYTAVDCSTGSGSWFGSAGLRPGSTRSRAADIVVLAIICSWTSPLPTRARGRRCRPRLHPPRLLVSPQSCVRPRRWLSMIRWPQ